MNIRTIKTVTIVVLVLLNVIGGFPAVLDYGKEGEQKPEISHHLSNNDKSPAAYIKPGSPSIHYVDANSAVEFEIRSVAEFEIRGRGLPFIKGTQNLVVDDFNASPDRWLNQLRQDEETQVVDMGVDWNISRSIPESLQGLYSLAPRKGSEKISLVLAIVE